jgi:hypothetical protein
MSWRAVVVVRAQEPERLADAFGPTLLRAALMAMRAGEEAD